MDLSAIVNALHLLAAVTWVGGMAFVILVLEPSLVSLEPVERGRLMGVVGRRFSIISWAAVILLLATGFVKTPDGLLFDASEGYGALLLAKHITVLLMILVGLRISLGLVPRIRREAPQPGQPPSAGFLNAQKQFRLLSRLNLLLGVVVLVLVARL